MSKAAEFKVNWEADDGYMGGSRPHSFKISAGDLDDEADEAELEKMFYEYLQCEFEEHCTPVSSDCDKFIAWAKDQLEAARGEQ